MLGLVRVVRKDKRERRRIEGGLSGSVEMQCWNDVKSPLIDTSGSTNYYPATMYP